MSGGFGLCPHCRRYQVWREPDGDLACVTCGWRQSIATVGPLEVTDPRMPYDLRLPVYTMNDIKIA